MFLILARYEVDANCTYVSSLADALCGSVTMGMHVHRPTPVMRSE